MDDKKKTELWQQLVSKHTAAAKAAAEADGSVAKEITPPAGDPPPADAPAAGAPATGNDQLVAANALLTARVDALEAKLVEIGKAYDGAVAKAASDQAVAKAELDKSIADTKALVATAQAAADRIEALAPRGAGKRIDEVGKGKDAAPPAEKTEAELLAENAPGILKMAPGAK
jgi:hypothetical protein